MISTNASDSFRPFLGCDAPASTRVRCLRLYCGRPMAPVLRPAQAAAPDADLHGEGTVVFYMTHTHVRTCLLYDTHTQHATIDDINHFLIRNLSEMYVGTTATTVPTGMGIMAAAAA